MANNIDILVKARDEASATLKQVAASADLTKEQIKELGESRRALAELRRSALELDAAGKSIKALGDESEATGKRMSGFMGTVKAGFAEGLGIATGVGLIAGGVAAFKAGIVDSITAASSLNETINKSQVIFGSSAASIAEFGDSSAKALGQSKQQSIEAAAGFGNLFKTMGVGREASAGMSKEMVKLASDLASFHNIRPEEALEKLRSGLVGEAEPMRALGVLLNEATVNAKAMEMGLAKNANQVSESAKVQARYALILEQTGDAQGDFERTSGSLANQQRILAAQVENAKASIGSVLLPVVLDTVTELNNAITATSGWMKSLEHLGAQAEASGIPLSDLARTLNQINLMGGGLNGLAIFGGRALGNQLFGGTASAAGDPSNGLGAGLGGRDNDLRSVPSIETRNQSTLAAVFGIIDRVQVAAVQQANRVWPEVIKQYDLDKKPGKGAAVKDPVPGMVDALIGPVEKLIAEGEKRVKDATEALANRLKDKASELSNAISRGNQVHPMIMGVVGEPALWAQAGQKSMDALRGVVMPHMQRMADDANDAGRQVLSVWGNEAVAAWDTATNSLRSLEGQQQSLSDAIAASELSTQRAAEALKDYQRSAADAAEELDGLKGQLSEWEDAKNRALGTNLTGTKAFDDAQFERDRQIKELQLRKMQLEKSGPLKTFQPNLDRQYDPETGTVKAVGGSREVLTLAGQQVDGIDKQIEAIRRTSEQARLEFDLTIGTQQHALKGLADTSQEQSYSTLAGVITEANTRRDQLIPQIYSQQFAVNVANDAVTRGTKALEGQQGILDGLKGKYDKITEATGRWRSDMNDILGLANQIFGERMNAEAGNVSRGNLPSWMAPNQGGSAVLIQLLESLKAEKNRNAFEDFDYDKLAQVLARSPIAVTIDGAQLATIVRNKQAVLGYQNGNIYGSTGLVGA